MPPRRARFVWTNDVGAPRGARPDAKSWSACGLKYAFAFSVKSERSTVPCCSPAKIRCGRSVLVRQHDHCRAVVGEDDVLCREPGDLAAVRDRPVVAEHADVHAESVARAHAAVEQHRALERAI